MRWPQNNTRVAVAGFFRRSNLVWTKPGQLSTRIPQHLENLSQRPQPAQVLPLELLRSKSLPGNPQSWGGNHLCMSRLLLLNGLQLYWVGSSFPMDSSNATKHLDVGQLLQGLIWQLEAGSLYWRSLQQSGWYFQDNLRICHIQKSPWNMQHPRIPNYLNIPWFFQFVYLYVLSLSN